MRVILLTALILAPLYYLNRDTKMSVPLFGTDEVKVKSSAPKRPVYERKVIQKLPTPKQEKYSGFVPSETSEEAGDEHFEEIAENSDSNEQHFRGPALHDLEAGWNAALLEFLGRVEPADAEQMHEKYVLQQDAYQAEFEAIMAEKQQKSSDEEAFQIEEAIAHLEEVHEQRLQEILGAHYEAVRDYYEGYMDSVEVEEAHD